MIEPETENSSPALEEASRELQAAGHDAQVAFDCIALGDIDRAHTHALTAKVAADAAVTALAAALSQSEPGRQAGRRRPTVTPARWITRSYRLRRGSTPVAGRGFAFRPGTVVVYADPGIASVAGRFCAQIARRTGVRLPPGRAARYRVSRPSRSSVRPRANWTGSPPRPVSRRAAATRPANGTRW